MAYLHDSERLVVHVTDTGVGIAADDIPKLFTRFGKLHRTAYMNNDGLGLGLTIVKNIVEASDGQIQVFSEGIGKGTTVCFDIKLQSMQNQNGERQQIQEEDQELVGID